MFGSSYRDANCSNLCRLVISHQFWWYFKTLWLSSCPTVLQALILAHTNYLVILLEWMMLFLCIASWKFSENEEHFPFSSHYFLKYHDRFFFPTNQPGNKVDNKPWPSEQILHRNNGKYNSSLWCRQELSEAGFLQPRKHPKRKQKRPHEMKNFLHWKENSQQNKPRPTEQAMWLQNGGGIIASSTTDRTISRLYKVL